MKKIVLSGIMVLFLSGCMASPGDKTPKKEAAPIQNLSAVQQKEDKISKSHAHLENMKFLKTKFANTSKLTDTQKEGLVNCFESQYPQPVLLSEQRYNGKVVYFGQIVNNPKLTPKQMKAALKARFKQENKGQGGIWKLSKRVRGFKG